MTLFSKSTPPDLLVEEVPAHPLLLQGEEPGGGAPPSSRLLPLHLVEGGWWLLDGGWWMVGGWFKMMVGG